MSWCATVGRPSLHERSLRCWPGEGHRVDEPLPGPSWTLPDGVRPAALVGRRTRRRTQLRLAGHGRDVGGVPRRRRLTAARGLGGAAATAIWPRAARRVGASQGRIRVPLPPDRRPTTGERSTAGLEDAVWAPPTWPTGARRRGGRRLRRALPEGLPRRRPRLRVIGPAGGSSGGSRLEHPVRPASWRQSIRSQRARNDDVLMRAVHGPDWRARAHVPAGRRRWHLATTAALLVAAVPRTRSRDWPRGPC
jgi:hypothetical protein